MVHYTEVSKGLRLLQVASAIIWCFLGAGTIFGFAAFKPVLVAENVYSEYCTPEEIQEGKPICTQQELKLNFIFTLGAVVTNVVSIFVGLVLDWYGPRVCGLLGALFLACGSLTLRSALEIEAFDAFIVGYTFLALGGPFTSISAFQLSNAFPSSSGVILALITGAFDMSSAIFLFYRISYFSTDGALTLHKFFTLYLITPLFLVLVQLTIMPKESYKATKDVAEITEENIPSLGSRRLSILINQGRSSSSSETRRLLTHSDGPVNYTQTFDDDDGHDHEQAQKAFLEEIIQKSGIWGVLHGKSVPKQVKTPWFYLMMAFTTILMVRINYFVATVYSQYSYLFDSYQQAKELNSFFDIALPSGGAIAVPFIGLLLDNFSSLSVLTVLASVSIFIAVLGLFPYHFTAILNVSLLTVYRPFYYTCVSDYCAKVFGFDTFGTIYGCIVAFAGAMNFVQSPFDILTHEYFNNDPTPVNILLLSITILSSGSLLLYIYSQSRHLSRAKLNREAESAPIEVMPGSDLNE